MAQGSLFDRIFVRNAQIWAGLAGVLGLFEVWAVLRVLFRAAFWPDAVSAFGSLIAIPLALPAAIAVSYLVRHELLHGLRSWQIAAGERPGPVTGAYIIAVQICFACFALQAGMAATLMLYGAEGPFSDVIDGISGFGVLLPISTWPIAFAGGIAAVYLLYTMVMREMRRADGDGSGPGKSGEPSVG